MIFIQFMQSRFLTAEELCSAGDLQYLTWRLKDVAFLLPRRSAFPKPPLEFRVTQNDTAGTDPVVETILEAADLHKHAHTLALAISWLLYCYVWKCRYVEVPLQPVTVTALSYRTDLEDSCSGGTRAPLQVKVTVFSCSSLSKSFVKHFSPFLFFQNFSI